MVWPAIIGAVAGLGMGGLSAEGQRKANHEELDFLRESRDIMRQDTNTAYQRVVKDMAAAGLNPMLAYQQGGAQSAGSAGTPNIENVLGAGVSSAAQGMSMVQGFQQMAQSEAQTEQFKAQTDQVRAQTLDKEMYNARARADLESAVQEARAKGHGASAAAYEEVIKKYDSEVKSATKDAEIDRIRSRAGKEGVDYRIRRDTEEAEKEGIKARSEISRYGVDSARAESEFYRGLGEYNPYLKAILQIIRMGK